ncbi:MAG: murein transglycosylase A [Nitrospiraceae bacterium]|nr:MAG: murein transglycosylase A [Nitrospiraceae bacterium]
MTLVFSIWYGCSLFIKPRPEPKLENLTSQQVFDHDWTDDLMFVEIDRAIEQSIRYYERLSPDEVFQYGERMYSSKEMIASLTLFLKIIESSEGNERLHQLKEKFLFFESKNAEGEAYFTGYYEPLLEGSLVPEGDFTEPLYETPHDLVEVDLGDFSNKWKYEKIVGRLVGNKLVPYDSRDDIVHRKSLVGRANPLAYVKEIELFFLQIQGSGLIRLQDGNTLRVNYSQKNGHPYKAIGKILFDRIPEEKMSLQAIKEYLYAHPEEVKDVLNYNQSYVFFRVVEEGPLGNIDVPLTPLRSIAMDKRGIPKGGLAYIQTEIPFFDDEQVIGWKSIRRFSLVQDTGGAIRDHGRADIFLGHGKESELIAGYLKQRGRIFLIVAKKEFLNQ